MSWLETRWPLFALIASAALLAGAHAFESFGGLAPCMLCLKQRDVHWGIVALAVVSLALLRHKPELRPLANLILGLAFLASCAVASYHVAVELKWVIALCEAGDISDITTLGAGPLELPACDKPAWTLFGISMAGYNAVISLALAALSFAFAWKPNNASSPK